jgi:hypothetical protein
MKVTRKEIPHYSQYPPSYSIRVDKVKNEEGEVVAYKAYSKGNLELEPAEADTQFQAIQGFHRRMRIYQQTDSAEEANKADVAANSKDPRILV